ncbi:MAG: hypothetical protein US89_C0002G0017 [Candidatus Peregrinibacteria bacterium GW2011_GWF2_38_29]|nr:MAG: hypothetical protein US89_C0002G0017 [Candidatus Peregrinibacteria bacterium GW2011_GWF2_38_29]HBB02172.1 hypothetical protein [Candidatus Peregrinibacteria bacterium]
MKKKIVIGLVAAVVLVGASVFAFTSVGNMLKGNVVNGVDCTNVSKQYTSLQIAFVKELSSKPVSLSKLESHIVKYMITRNKDKNVETCKLEKFVSDIYLTMRAKFDAAKQNNSATFDCDGVKAKFDALQAKFLNEMAPNAQDISVLNTLIADYWYLQKINANGKPSEDITVCKLEDYIKASHDKMKKQVVDDVWPKLLKTLANSPTYEYEGYPIRTGIKASPIDSKLTRVTYDLNYSVPDILSKLNLSKLPVGAKLYMYTFGKELYGDMSLYTNNPQEFTIVDKPSCDTALPNGVTLSGNFSGIRCRMPSSGNGVVSFYVDFNYGGINSYNKGIGFTNAFVILDSNGKYITGPEEYTLHYTTEIY